MVKSLVIGLEMILTFSTEGQMCYIFLKYNYIKDFVIFYFRLCKNNTAVEQHVPKIELQLERYKYASSVLVVSKRFRRRKCLGSFRK